MSGFPSAAKRAPCVLGEEVVKAGVGLTANGREGCDGGCPSALGCRRNAQGLFEAFTQTSEDIGRKYEGHGLGPSVTKDVLSQMDGSIEVDDKIEAETLFTVRLPTSQPCSSEDLVTRNHSQWCRLARKFQYNEITHSKFPAVIFPHLVPHLLSVEDNSETRVLLKHFLGGSYELTFATSAKEALGILCSDDSVDLLLVDINLGSGPSGTDLLREVMACGEIGDVLAVALTAYAMPGDREELLEKGFNGYLGKPFTRKELTDTINQTLSGAG